MIDPYVFVGLKSSPKEIKQTRPFKNIGKPVLSIWAKRNQIGVNADAKKLLKIDVGDRVVVTEIGQDVFISKSSHGCSVLRNNRNCVIANKQAVKTVISKTKSVHIEIVKTRHEFNGNKLFRLNIKTRRNHRVSSN